MDNADYRRFWSRNPSWFREGLSELYAFHNVSPRIESTLLPTRFITTRRRAIRNERGYFESISRHPESGGYLLARYFVARYGAAAAFKILATNGSFEQALSDVLNISYTKFRRQWLSWAENNIGGTYPIHAVSISELTRITANCSEPIVTRYEVENTSVQQRASTTVTATVKNLGDNLATLNVTFYKDGDAVITKHARIDGNTTIAVSAHIRFNTTGIHTITVGDLKKVNITVESSLAHQYDADNNGQIGDREILTAITDWQNGNLGDFEILKLTDLWQTEKHITAVTSRPPTALAVG